MIILDAKKFHNPFYNKIVYHNIIENDLVVCSIRKANSVNINKNIQPIEIPWKDWGEFTLENHLFDSDIGITQL